MKLPLLSLTCYLLMMASSAKAIILFGGDNTANTTDPGAGHLWSAVAKVTDSGKNLSGSAVYLGNGYLLTAKHLTSTAKVTFDGSTYYDVDQSFHSTFSTNVDLKVVRLTEIPGSLTGVQLLGTPSEQAAQVLLIGWGVGRQVPDATGPSFNWGGTGTSTKRWGANMLEGLVNVSGAGYQSQGLYFNLDADSSLGDDEAAMTQYDSGSGMFQFINGQWYLVGINIGVSASNVSTFGEPGDMNFAVRISPYYDEILANMEVIPEPSTVALLLTVALGGACFALKRRK